jgi:multicomponent Na+:H+ antiporter subunit D
MIHQLLIWPLLFQLLLAVILLFLWNFPRWQRRVSMVGSVVAVVIAAMLMHRVWHGGMITLQAGNWKAPFGITLVADTFAATLILLSAIVGLAVSVYSRGAIVTKRVRFGYFAILHFLLMGLNGAFLTGDIFNLYVWFEVIIISSFVLLTIGGEKMQIEGAVKYFTLNMLASVIFLTAIAVLYGLTGTLNMADLATQLSTIENRGLVNVCALIFFTGFGIKSAVFPLYFWLPASYHTPPAAVSAIFGGLLTKVGVYAMIRVFMLLFDRDPFMDNLILGIAACTIVTGGLGAIKQDNFKKVFSYLIICHIGFMVAGLGMFSKVALAGAVFYMIHDILVKSNLFLVGGILYRINGTRLLSEMGGVLSSHPRLSLLMAVPLFAVVGIPPLSGFWPKISLLKAAGQEAFFGTLALILLGSFLTLYAVARVWSHVFWKAAPGMERLPDIKPFGRMSLKERTYYVLPVALLALATLYIGVFANDIQELSNRIAEELFDKQNYIQRVTAQH